MAWLWPRDRCRYFAAARWRDSARCGGGYLLLLLVRALRSKDHESRASLSPGRIITAGVLLTVGAIVPLVPWTVRNLHTLHRFEPLAPRYANDSDELVMK